MSTGISDQQPVVAMLDYIEAMLREADRRYDQRYEAQTIAVTAAFTAEQTAMQAALASAERAVTAALDAAGKAVDKAETAAEKRFDSVNEFRQQLADQAATFMPRSESESLLAAMSIDYQQRFEAAAAAREFALAVSEKAVIKAEVATEKRFEAMSETHKLIQDQIRNVITRAEFESAVGRLSDLSSRIDRTEGTSQGKNLSWGYLVGAMTLAVIVVNIVAFVVAHQ
jgi:hypothetical protein